MGIPSVTRQKQILPLLKAEHGNRTIPPVRSLPKKDGVVCLDTAKFLVKRRREHEVVAQVCRSPDEDPHVLVVNVVEQYVICHMLPAVRLKGKGRCRQRPSL
jgi:hypothetical protein